MSILSFRVNVPTATQARNPVKHQVISGASAIHSLMIWSVNANALMDEAGFRCINRLGTTIIPDIGSRDGFTFANGEDGWCPIPNQPQPIPMFDQVIEGPPCILEFQFYNIDAAAILVGGIVVVREPMVRLAEEAAIYSFLQNRKPEFEEVSPETRTDLSTEKKNGIKFDIDKLLKKETNLVPEKK